MPFPYKKVLVVGATSGIGWALAERLLANKVKVVIVGRRQDRLEEFKQKHNEDDVSSFVFDISKLQEIPKFASDVTKAHPDLDCVFLNSGIQRMHDFSKPETIKLDVIDEEVTTNYLSFLHLTNAFMPHLQQHKGNTSFIYTTSGLALIPITRVPNYCATKAALHHFILTLREQVKSGPGSVKIIELMPPAVQTELHDTKHQPDMPEGAGAKIGMPLAQFTDEAWEGLEKGEEQIAVGDICVNATNSWEKERQKTFHAMVAMMSKGGK
jgi:short-subunit dehydrogenase involved in D-alanine esterification of teichoic acids